MTDDATWLTPLPEQADLRDIAEAMEAAGMAFTIYDARFRCVYVSREQARMSDMSADEARQQIGQSGLNLGNTDPEIFRIDRESAAAWFRHNAPIMRRYVAPADDDFEEIFASSAPYAAAIEPAKSAPRAWYDRIAVPEDLRFRRYVLGDQNHVRLRINDDNGLFVGLVFFFRGVVPESVLQRLGRGDPELIERIDSVREPSRRPTAILFADLEASGVLSRRLSSRGYFQLIRDLTDLIDRSVVAHNGIPGKHAGDGGSALFLTAHFEGSESAASRAAIETARAIRDGAAQLRPENLEVRVNIGLHWGATLMVGQVATTGRLEVTALGDPMNECARIEAAATGGLLLASKDMIERLDAADAQMIGVDADSLAYTMLSEIAGASDKAIRDAGSIAVAAL